MVLKRREFLGAWLGAAVASAEASVRTPFVQDIGETRASVHWTATERRACVVRLVGSNGEVRQAEAVSRLLDKGVIHYAARFTGLSAGTDYTYEVLRDGAPASVASVFRTVGASPMQFLAVGDTGDGSDNQRRLADRMATERPRLVLHTGDVAYPTGQLESYEKNYLDFYHAIMRSVPFYPCPGNHDYYETGAQPYRDLHAFPASGVPEADRGRYYSFDWGDIHFVSLDTNEALTDAVERGGAMLRWLDADLEQSRKFWRVVYFHHPPFAEGPNSGDPLSLMARRHIVPILARHAVPVVFSGHEHSYQRTHPIDGAIHFTTGGGGALLYEVLPSPHLAFGASRHHYLRVDVAGRGMRVQAVGTDGKVFDTAPIAPTPRVRNNGIVNAASLTPAIGRGAVATVFGWHLSLDGRDIEVRVNGESVPLLYASPTQVNFTLPASVVGRARIAVTTPTGAAESEFDVVPVAPALFEGTGSVVVGTGMSGHVGPVLVRVAGLGVEGRLQRTSVDGVDRVLFQPPGGIGPGKHYLTVEAGGAVSNAIPWEVEGT
jgi:3',5'-cyclic AMP phosphodiesterase CpdA